MHRDLLPLQLRLQDLESLNNDQALLSWNGVVLSSREWGLRPESKVVLIFVWLDLEEHSFKVVIIYVSIYQVWQVQARKRQNWRWVLCFYLRFKRIFLNLAVLQRGYVGCPFYAVDSTRPLCGSSKVKSASSCYTCEGESRAMLEYVGALYVWDLWCEPPLCGVCVR